MHAQRSTDLGRAVTGFFHDYLPAQRGVSTNTLRSYRDAVVLWLQFLAGDTRKRMESLTITDATHERAERFLTYLETNRGNSVLTRNARLAALHTFARYIGSGFPEHLGLVQGMLGIPFKRGAKQRAIEYLETGEVDQLLKCIDRRTRGGQRDYALFSLMFNTGARVQEILDLRVSDLRLQPPEQVRLRGKGNRIRSCPLWPRTARLLRDLIAARAAEQFVFLNQNGRRLTRFGVRYLLRKYLPQYRSAVGNRRIHAHAIRHTTAVHLLKAGVEFATISQWLGHASLTTTMRYARADLDLKRKALAHVFPGTLGAPVGGSINLHGSELTRWLRRL